MECQQKKLAKGKACFIFFFCVLCSACRVEICYSLYLLLCYHQIIASYAFTENILLAGFPVSSRAEGMASHPGSGRIVLIVHHPVCFPMIVRWPIIQRVVYSPTNSHKAPRLPPTVFPSFHHLNYGDLGLVSGKQNILCVVVIRWQGSPCLNMSNI